ncbi:CAP domain-containing protein [Streptomyces sp. NBC_00096]|uniref:CAP domain-containing protein n=1 Tax=Streptomyces sp. NBC_00096 TaxID=2975650 RepID=UPI00324E90C3
MAGVGVMALAGACAAGVELIGSPADRARSVALDIGATGTAVDPPSSSAPVPESSARSTSATPKRSTTTPSAKASKSTKPKAPATAKASPSRTAKQPAPKPTKTSSKKQPAPKPETAAKAAGSSQAQEVVRLVNVERAAQGCRALEVDADLTEAAQGYSDTMAATGNFAHTGTDGSQPQDRIEAAGYAWSASGENIAMGQTDADAVVDAWMNSPGHRANILNCGFTEIGVGVNTNGGPWWTQNFGTPA